MKAKTPASRRADEMIQSVYSAFLKPLQFKKSGRKFFRSQDGITQRVDFSAFWWSTAEETDLCIDLVIAHPDVYEAVTGNPAPKNFHLCYPMIQQRLHDVSSAQVDQRFPIRATSDVTRIAAEVVRLLKSYGLPWLEEFGSRDKLLDKFSHGEFPPTLLGGHLAHAMLLGERGEWTVARKVLASVEGDHGSIQFRATIERVRDWIANLECECTEDGPAR